MRKSWQRVAAGVAFWSIGAHGGYAGNAPVELAKFTGIASCQSSSCHGGGTGKDQCTIFESLDYHVRADAILLTPRSKVITDALQMGNPATNVRCIICHAPLQAVPAARLLPGAHVDEGFSCETCHGAASGWLRSHTRTDYTEAQRIASGMTELRGAYARANACVACHEYLSPDIAKAGHPPLVFELDSQVVSEPPHWRETDPWIGLRSWLAGQAVAYREDTWHVLKNEPGAPARWEALGWILQATTAGMKGLPDFAAPDFTESKGEMSARELAAAQTASDRLAKRAADFPWTAEAARGLLQALAGRGADIANATSKDAQLNRAEVLAQALDRLLVGLHAHAVTIPGSAEKLNALFADVRVPEAFDAERYCGDLAAFAGTVGKR